MTSPRTPRRPSPTLPSHSVDGARLWFRLQDLARHGATRSGGVNRPAFSAADQAARRTVTGWAQEAGLAVSGDAAGNLFLKLEGLEPDAKPVLTGAYLDTQPAGGKYAGSFGVVAALEALQAVQAMGRPASRPLIAAIWANGEGSRFSPGYAGSEAFAGLLSLATMHAVTDGAGISCRDALASTLAAETDIARIGLGFACSAYVEAHLEQGPMLEQRGSTIGAVTALQGVRTCQVRVFGEASHAGTTPRHRRRDALKAAMRIIAALDSFYASPDIGFAVGQLSVEPNAPSVIARQVTFVVDIRHPDTTTLQRLGDTVRLICESEKGPCRLEIQALVDKPAIMFPADIARRIEQAAAALSLPHMPILSLAGHDARSLVKTCPTGIIFIPCRDGLSHNEAEAIEPGHAHAGAQVLADVLWDLANST